MVFFTAMLIVIILYYLQADGLIYATIIALIAELINIFMAHTLTKSVEKKMKAHTRRLVEGYSRRLKANHKTIQELEQIREDSVKNLYNANLKIKEYEAKLEVLGEKPAPSASPPPDKEPPQKPSPKKKPDKKAKKFDDLPAGSNRKKLPI